MLERLGVRMRAKVNLQCREKSEQGMALHPMLERLPCVMEMRDT